MAELKRKQRISPGKSLLLVLLLAGVPLAALGKMMQRDTAADYPAAIMVDGTVYLVPVDPLPAGTVDEGEISGCVESYTETFPEKTASGISAGRRLCPTPRPRAALPCCVTARGTCATPHSLMTMVCSCPAETAPERPRPDIAEPS